MTSPDSRPLLIDLSGPGWHAMLTVQQPARHPVREVEFDVPRSYLDDEPALTEHTPLERIQTEVLYTTATNRKEGWARWHVKLYLCRTEGDANLLLEHLRRQALALARANSRISGLRGKTPIEPPWAVVPVQVVRGDGSIEKGADAVTTRLGAPSELIHAQVEKSAFPDWFLELAPPQLQLLAISPEIDYEPWAAQQRRPATQHLRGFAMLAVGLDELHAGSWAHCDIKPDNVCWATDLDGGGFVLIDTDAATQAVPPPPLRALRLTARYRYQGIPRHGGDHKRELRPGLLYAQDRFGFLTVVLSALAGRNWVDTVLLRADPDATDGTRRVADSEHAVYKALSELWPDPGWQPLIAALAVPFGTGEHGQITLEAPGSWAQDWLARIRAAEEHCTPAETDGVHRAPSSRTPAVERSPLALIFEREIREIRQLVTDVPAPGAERVRRGHRAIAEVAHRVAMRRAVLWASVWGAGLTVAAAVVAFGVLVMGG